MICSQGCEQPCQLLACIQEFWASHSSFRSNGSFLRSRGQACWPFWTGGSYSSKRSYNLLGPYWSAFWLPHSPFSSGRWGGSTLWPAAEDIGPGVCLHTALCPVVTETPSVVVEEVLKAVQVWCFFKSHSAKTNNNNNKSLKLVLFPF